MDEKEFGVFYKMVLNVNGYACLVAQSCPTLCETKDGSLSGSSVHAVLLARILEWNAICYSRGSSWPGDWTCISHISCNGRQIFTTTPPGKPMGWITSPQMEMLTSEPLAPQNTTLFGNRAISEPPQVTWLPWGHWDTRASLVAQLEKNPPAMRETWVWSLGWEDPLEKGMATHSGILAWRIPWTV